MKKRNLFPMNNMDLKFNTFVIIFFSIELFRTLEKLFDSINVNLLHTFNIVP